MWVAGRKAFCRNRLIPLLQHADKGPEEAGLAGTMHLVASAPALLRCPIGLPHARLPGITAAAGLQASVSTAIVSSPAESDAVHCSGMHSAQQHQPGRYCCTAMNLRLGKGKALIKYSGTDLGGGDAA